MYPRPDYDCNGVDDTTQGHCSPDGLTKCESSADCPNNHPCLFGGDACPYYAEDRPFSGSNSDGRGDACQCGDLNGDGALVAVINGQVPATEMLCARDQVP